MKNRAPLLVSAAIIYRKVQNAGSNGKAKSSGEILVGQRRRSDRHSLKWEFPGGKVEIGETPQQALARELQEELTIGAKIGCELARYEHDYSSGSRIHLLFFVVTEFEGNPEARVFEQIRWTPLEWLPQLDFLEGDIDFVRRLARGEFARQLAR
ncbi:MAG TPA: (deoxy)nucleoside triphosphate pyrophosphohydrolase [Bryobacteraceae bacterium]|jgi:8-oxo-dGTP diphosphatase|nr:(deoxy)nucleoside triphosphate pyrophosphohydrolase [Bryobacteraceae bacterium]